VPIHDHETIAGACLRGQIAQMIPDLPRIIAGVRYFPQTVESFV
jgi:hypothetical protein